MTEDKIEVLLENPVILKALADVAAYLEGVITDQETKSAGVDSLDSSSA
jgi:hypothetical protein